MALDSVSFVLGYEQGVDAVKEMLSESVAGVEGASAENVKFQVD